MATCDNSVSGKFRVLEVRLKSARLETKNNTKTYATAYIRPETKLQTKVNSSAGSTPVWDEKFVFSISDISSVCRFEVYLAYGYGYSAGIVYEQMEKDLKVYMYRDRDPGAYFQSPGKLTGIYGSEAYFFKNIKESRFLPPDPLQAQPFFIPISWHQMRSQGTPYENMTTIIPSLILATDHFFETCHDIGVDITEGVKLLEKKSIRLVCPASNDISLPQVNQSFYRPAAANATVNRTESGLWAGISYSV